MKQRLAPAFGSVLVVSVLLLVPSPVNAEDEHDHGGQDAPETSVGAVGTGGSGDDAPWSHGGEADLAHLASSEIQARIDGASPGAVISVETGMYHGDLVVDRDVTLRAAGHVMIVGDGDGSVITVTGSGASVIGLHVRRSGIGPLGGPAGIRVEGDQVTIEQNLVDDTYMGIAVYGVSGVKLLGNTVLGRADAAIDGEGHATSATAAEETAPPPGAPGEHDHGAMTEPATLGGRPLRGDAITLWNATDAVVRGNVVEHARDGVFVSFGANLLFDGNQVSGSRYALHTMFARELFVVENTFEANLSGAVMMYGGDVLMLRNRIEASSSATTGFGVLLKDVEGCDAVENVLVGNRVGIQIDGPSGDFEHPITVHGNTIALNGYGLSLYPSAHATFYRNSFVENTAQVVAQGHGVAGKNTWSHEGIGNYWSDYRGYDAGGEGVGDVPHHVGGSVETLLVRAPVLQALASGPALSLLSAVEDRWVEHDPIVMDPLPLMEPHSPALAGDASAGSASGPLATAGLVAVAAAGAALVVLRRPLRRGRASHAG